MTTDIVKLIDELIDALTCKHHKQKLKDLIDAGNDTDLLIHLKYIKKLENQRIRNKRFYYKHKEPTTI